VQTRFLDSDPMQANVVAEIPGTDRAGEVVMLGAHLDSWHAGTGATDNGAGAVATMEAARILKAIGAAPRRTIRIALWSGEEQGLFGSRAYVAQHFATRPESREADQKNPPESYRRKTWPITPKPEHGRFSAYFNLDNGSGKIRGIYAEQNAAVVPIFEKWIAPLKDLGVTTVTMRNTTGTDHEAFDEVGLPGFQFIQDDLEYETRTHHSNVDTYERLVAEDLKQASVVIAAFVWQAATRPDALPRKPMPTEPKTKDARRDDND
jgi:Zn-dependent M28 family amino/carboxypeptidase